MGKKNEKGKNCLFRELNPVNLTLTLEIFSSELLNSKFLEKEAMITQSQNRYDEFTPS